MRTFSSDAPPFSLIEQGSLASRLIRELEGALGELTRDPRGFIRELVSADTRDAKRRQRLRLGLVAGLAFHIALITMIAVLGWRTIHAKPDPKQPTEYTVIFPGLAPTEKTEPTKADVPKGDDGGGGGGGQHTPLPPSQGVRPLMVPGPQIVNMNPSNIAEPSLPVSPTIVGPTSEPPPPAPIGDPTGKSKDFSGGPGDKGGIGHGEGTGVGSGKDSGTEPGGRGGKGGKVAGSPDGSGTELPPIDFGRTGSTPGYRTWSWIRRQTPVITPEAQENKVIGTVVLRADFNADGTITNISLAMRVDFMSESAMDALRRSTFHPATVKGVPVTVRNVLIRVDVHY